MKLTQRENAARVERRQTEERFMKLEEEHRDIVQRVNRLEPIVLALVADDPPKQLERALHNLDHGLNNHAHSEHGVWFTGGEVGVPAADMTIPDEEIHKLADTFKRGDIFPNTTAAAAPPADTGPDPVPPTSHGLHVVAPGGDVPIESRDAAVTDEQTGGYTVPDAITGPLLKELERQEGERYDDGVVAPDVKPESKESNVRRIPSVTWGREGENVVTPKARAALFTVIEDAIGMSLARRELDNILCALHQRGWVVVPAPAADTHQEPYVRIPVAGNAEDMKRIEDYLEDYDDRWRVVYDHSFPHVAVPRAEFEAHHSNVLQRITWALRNAKSNEPASPPDPEEKFFLGDRIWINPGHARCVYTLMSCPLQENMAYFANVKNGGYWSSQLLNVEDGGYWGWGWVTRAAIDAAVHARLPDVAWGREGDPGC